MSELMSSSDTVGLRLAEVVSALSLALDMTDGQPAGHSVRCCWIGMHLAQSMGMDPSALTDLYYMLLLKDLGCSSNAARICQLFVANDHDFKRDIKLVDNSLGQVLKFVAANTAVKSGLADRLRAIVKVAMQGGQINHEMIETRCERGAEIARRMRFSEAVAQGILDLDEHWDGRGQPLGRKGADISAFARIALLSQVVDVFNTTSGRASALKALRQRSGKWFDPAMVRAFEAIAVDPAFWDGLDNPHLPEMVFALEPVGRIQAVDDDFLDDIADGFAQVIDAKSPFTSGHSKRVALVTELVSSELGLAPERKRWLVRAALLHDIGKLGVSNEVLDKPGKLDAEEWTQMKRHPLMGAAILDHIAVFSGMADIARQHHERLDGTGYPLGLQQGELSLDARIVAVADVFDALTADRPYRAAMPTEKALAIMFEQAGTGLDGDCLSALVRAIERLSVAA